VDGLADGLALLHGLLARYWDGLHPALDADDDDGPLMRMNALAALVDPTVGLKAVRGADWLVHGGVRCDVRTGLRVLGIEPDGPEPDLSPTALERLIRAATGSGVGNSARRAIETARTLAALLDERVGAHRAPDLKPLSQMLRPLADAFDRAAGVEVGASPVPEAGATPQAAGASDVASPAAAAPGRIASREDASRALDAVCEWLERQEPANPAPLLIRRAQRLMTMNFLDIMRDMAPDALGAVETIAGRQPDSE
jgi:type VI secretion system protein ImpA